MKVPLADIVAIEGDAPAAKGDAAGAGARRRGITVHARASVEYPEEINVIGSTVEEATERVDKFLDDAALAGRSSVRIIHGHGTGALRRGLAEFWPRIRSSSEFMQKPRIEAARRLLWQNWSP